MLIMVLNTFILIGLVLNLMILRTYQHETTQITVPIKERIEFLKMKINQQMTHKLKEASSKTAVMYQDVEYVDHSHDTLTPVMNHAHFTADNFRLPELKTTTTTILPWDPTTPKEDFSHLRSYQEKVKFIEKPTETFYRRLISEDMKYRPIAWIHCQELITPFLNGMKIDLEKKNIWNVTDEPPQLLVKLLNKNVTGLEPDDMAAILYQISNIQIRLFQWSNEAFVFLFDGLTHDKRHSFLRLKNSLKRIFASWKLNFTAQIDKLLQGARIFRPPCIEPTYQDSTLSSKVSRYIKSTEPTVKYHDESADDTKEKPDC